MTRKISLNAIIISALLFISCKKELVPQDESSYLLTKDSSSTNLSSPQSLAEKSNIMATQQPSVQAVNPAHGQPGHDCNIAVGAPLNKPITQTAQQQIEPQPQVVTTIAKRATVVTPKGMNPPHGEKGHRCDIAVGAPLNTPAAQPKIISTTTEQVATETGQYQSLITNPDNLPSESKTTTVEE